MQSTLFTTLIWDNAFLFQSHRGGLAYRLVCLPKRQCVTADGEFAAVLAAELVRLEELQTFDCLMKLWKRFQHHARPLGLEGVSTLPRVVRLSAELRERGYR